MKLMKAVILVVAIFIILSLATQVKSQNQTSPTHTIDAAITYAKLHAINSPDIKWDSIAVAMNDAAHGAKSVADLKQSFDILLSSLMDQQASFFESKTKIIIASAKRSIEPQTPASEILSQFHFARLEHNVCYLRLPAIMAGPSSQKQIEAVREALDSLSKENAMQWIVDLRHTTGGDNRTLLAAVAPLFDEGLVATAADNQGKIKNMFTVHNGNLYVDQVVVTKLPLWTIDLRKARIAVLTSSQTSGAAELVALGLKGRRHTRIFGEATAGNNFATVDMQVTQSLTMRLSNLRYVDRKGNEYNNIIQPDVKIAYSATKDLNDDKAISEATAWLTSVNENAVALGMK
jgi:carboxyl-terminal processing protease